MSALHKSYSFKLESHVLGHGDDLPKMLSTFLVHYSYNPINRNSVELQQIYMTINGQVTELPSSVFSACFKQSLKKQILIENNPYLYK